MNIDECACWSLNACLTSPYMLCYNMAAPAKSTDGSLSVTTGQSATVSSVENVPLQYSLLLDHLIGDKRQIKDLNPTVMGALPSPQKTEEQKMIERGMESCAFKSLIACVGGISLIDI